MIDFTKQYMQTSMKIPKNINIRMFILETLFVSLVSGAGAGGGGGGAGGGGAGGGAGAAVSEDMSIYIYYPPLVLMSGQNDITLLFLRRPTI